MLFQLAKPDVEILDYSHSQLISLKVGRAKIKNGNFKLIHDIDLSQYAESLLEIEDTIKTNINTNNSLLIYLQHEVSQTKDLLHNLRPRTKRSIDILGTAWKWLAGTPDHDDFMTLHAKTNNVLKNNNQQVIINNVFQDKINNVTRIMNHIKNFVETNEKYKDELVLSLQYKLKLIKEELTNINYAVHWAKNGIINTLLISHKENELVTNIFDNEKFPYNSPEEAFDFATVKVATNSRFFIYIVNIPRTTKELYFKYLLKPIKKQNKIIEIPLNIITNEPFTEIYEILNQNCQQINELAICNRNKVNRINNTCVNNILRSVDSECNIVNGQHIPMVEEIDAGILLLNDFTGIIYKDEISQRLNGTFLIKFSNCTISVNDQKYTSMEKTNIQAVPAYFQPNPRERQYKEILSLEMMKEIHINNTKQIQFLAEEGNTNQIISYSTTSIVLVLAISISTILIFKCIKYYTTNQISIIQTKKSSIGDATPAAVEIAMVHQNSNTTDQLHKECDIIEDNKSKRGRVNILF